MELAEGVLLLIAFCSAVLGQYSSGGGKQHVYVTSKAADKKEDVWCYQCETMDIDDPCVNMMENRTSMIRKCPDTDRICSVKRITYTTLLDNGTLVTRMWSLVRNCTQRCDAGCIVMGERTKLHACTACCETSLCNIMTGGATPPRPRAPPPPTLLALAAAVAAAAAAVGVGVAAGAGGCWAFV
ncbi:hypothetical protein R5R35_012373 [Gryllus longicercus]|uniref:Uncharacterized protein n=1 Tax=Gryllus longicercus TaxID=2509291 RepID=A0AAN9VXN9_9ORTH